MAKVSLIGGVKAAMPKTAYGKLNARQKEVYNFQKVSAVLADYGFITIKLADDWLGADFLAMNVDGVTTLKVQLKSRLTLDKKYVDKDIWICFEEGGVWYLYPHDTVMAGIVSAHKATSSSSWTTKGIYHWPTIPSWAMPVLAPYAVSLAAMPKTAYGKLNARQKEVYNFQKVSAVLVDYGFITIKLAGTWLGVDFLALNMDGVTNLKVQLKSRLTLDKKYMGKGIWICFGEGGVWYLYHHDTVLDAIGKAQKADGATPFSSSSSWNDKGIYHWPAIPPWAKPVLAPYAL